MGIRKRGIERRVVSGEEHDSVEYDGFEEEKGLKIITEGRGVLCHWRLSC